MRIQDLHPDLSTQYNEERGYGIVKGQGEGFSHIYFVVPKPLPKEKSELASLQKEPLTRALVKAFSAINTQKDLSAMDGIDRLISRLIHRQEALSSSRIEGTYSTIDELFSAESDLSDKSDLEKAKSDSLSILDYAKAMDFIFARIAREKEKGINLALFEEIQRSIVSKDPNYRWTPGAMRSPGVGRHTVFIGGLHRREDSIYNPAPPEHVAPLMDAFIRWLSDEEIREEGDAGFGMPLPLRMALAHAHFEAIHPFPDGNGRVGRLIWPIQMLISGIAPIYISGYIEAEKNGYMEGLKAYQQKLDIIPLLEYIADALVSSKKEEEASRTALKLLPESWGQRTKARKGSSAERILSELLAHPVISAEEASQILKVSLQAALTGLLRLEEDGILKVLTKTQRRKKWAAHEVLTILKRPYGQSPREALEEVR